MTIFQTLKSDHRKVSAILEKLEKSTEKQATRREKLFAQFKAEMIPHAKAEEQAVYAPLKKKGEETRDLALEAKEEHLLVDHLISELDALDKSDETWGAKLTVLKELIEHHVEEEEDDMFKKMRKHFETSELKEIARQMQALKKQIRATPAAKPARLKLVA